MNLILFDQDRTNYYPLSLTRPISDFRVGILTIKQKWNVYFQSVSVFTESYLQSKFILNKHKDNVWINSNVIPSDDLVTELKNLRIGEALLKNGVVFAFRHHNFHKENLNLIDSHAFFNSIDKLTDIFTLNGLEIINDMKRLKLPAKGWCGPNQDLEKIKKNNTKIGKYCVYVDKGAKLSNINLNVSNGPIYIGKNTEIMEGTTIRGPFAMCDHSVVKMGSAIYPNTTIGPYSKIGGELNNVVLFGYSSKAHNGYLGNSVIGEWCNIGAGTNVSNLKNNYAEVKLWNYKTESFKNTGLQFCGVIMGDHSKTSINTMINTGSVIGFSVNLFGSGFPRNFIPSYSWGGSKGFITYNFNKMLDVAKRVCKRRDLYIDSQDEEIFKHIFSVTKSYRDARGY